MLKEAKMIYELIAVERGHFYVCGDCKMAENVYQTLKSIIQEQTGMNSTQSDKFMLGLRVSLRVAIYSSRKCIFFFYTYKSGFAIRVQKRYRTERIISFSRYTILHASDSTGHPVEKKRIPVHEDKNSWKNRLSFFKTVIKRVSLGCRKNKLTPSRI